MPPKSSFFYQRAIRHYIAGVAKRTQLFREVREPQTDVDWMVQVFRLQVGRMRLANHSMATSVVHSLVIGSVVNNPRKKKIQHDVSEYTYARFLKIYGVCISGPRLMPHVLLSLLDRTYVHTDHKPRINTFC
jgi:hypothetical protein